MHTNVHVYIHTHPHTHTLHIIFFHAYPSRTFHTFNIKCWYLHMQMLQISAYFCVLWETSHKRSGWVRVNTPDMKILCFKLKVIVLDVVNGVTLWWNANVIVLQL